MCFGLRRGGVGQRLSSFSQVKILFLSFNIAFFVSLFVSFWGKKYFISCCLLLVLCGLVGRYPIFA